MKISILICTLNEEGNISKRISNLKSLKIPDSCVVDVHVLDNGSTDDTCQIAESLKDDCNINIDVRILGPIGKCAALFWAYQHLDSDYYIMTDANTVFDSLYVVETLRYINKGKRSYLYIGNFRSIRDVHSGEEFFHNDSEMPLRHRVESFLRITSGANGACYCVSSEAVSDIWKFPAVRNDDFIISIYAFSKGLSSTIPTAKAYEVENLSFVEVFSQKYRDALGHYQAVTWLLVNLHTERVYFSIFFRLLYWLVPVFLLLFLFFLPYFSIFFILLPFFQGGGRLIVRSAALYIGLVAGIIRKPAVSWDTKR